MDNNKTKVHKVYKKTAYTVFYAARKWKCLDRITVSEDTGISIKRISDLEKGVGNPPGIDEILNLEDYYRNNVIRDYFIELITERGYYKPMPRRVQETSNLQKYIALDRPTMGNLHIMTVLEISEGNAINIRQKLEEKAINAGLELLPGAVIQRVVFEKHIGILRSDFEDYPDVIEYKKMRGK